MKTLVSYVLQDEAGHEHQTEILDVRTPAYSFSSDPPVSEVMKWAERKQQELPPNKRLIILNMFKM